MEKTQLEQTPREEIYYVEAEDRCSFRSHTGPRFLNRNFPTLHVSLKLMDSPQVLPTCTEHMVLLMCSKIGEKPLKPAPFGGQRIFPVSSPVIHPRPLGTAPSGSCQALAPGCALSLPICSSEANPLNSICYFQKVEEEVNQEMILFQRSP